MSRATDPLQQKDASSLPRMPGAAQLEKPPPAGRIKEIVRWTRIPRQNRRRTPRTMQPRYRRVRASPEPGAPAAAPQMPGGWGYRDVAYLILFAAAALVIVNVVGFAVYFGQGYLRGSPPSVLDSLRSAPLALAVQFVWWLTVLWFIYWRITARYGLPFGPAIGWTTRGHSRFHYLFFGVAP